MNLSRTIISSAFVCPAIFFCSLAFGQLDGKVFSVVVEEVDESGSSEHWTDEIFFNDSKVWMGFTQRTGFSDAIYTLTTETVDDLTTFYISATGTNKSGETLTWIIAITDQFIDGEAERSDTGTLYVFSGELK